MNVLNVKCLDYIVVMALLPLIHIWEMLGLHYGYYNFTINSLNGNCLEYIMVTTLLPLFH